jgi:hypothetical protein
MTGVEGPSKYDGNTVRARREGVKRSPRGVVEHTLAPRIRP